MEKSSQNDIKNNILSELSTDNTTTVMSHSSCEQDGGEEAGLLVNIVNEAVPAIASSHQSSVQETGSEGTAGNCQSNQEVECSGNCQQPFQDVCLVITHGSPTEYVHQENAFDVSLLECPVTTLMSDCQSDLEVRNDSSLLNGPELCNNATHKEVEFNCCDVSPDQDFEEFVEVPCATLKSVTKDVFKVNEPGSNVDFVGTVKCLDGREKFSEKSDQSQQNSVKSCYINNSIPVVCDRVDQICKGSVSCMNIMANEESVIQNEAKDCDTNIQVEQGNVVDTLYPSSNFCTVAGEFPCNPDLFRTLAASVVDEIIDKASKSVSELKNFDVKEIGLKDENVFRQVSVNGEQVVTKSPSEMTAWVSQNSAISLDSSDTSCTSDLKSSNDNIPIVSVSVASEIKNIFEPTPHNSNQSHSNLEHTTQNQAPIICNGNILLLKQSNYCSDSSSKHTLSDFDVSISTDCDKEVKNCVLEDLEAKATSNDCSVNCECVNKGPEYSSDIISMTDSVGEREDVKAAMDTGNGNTCLNDVKFVSDQDLEAKVDRSKDVLFGESPTAPSSSCLEHSIASSCVTISNLSSKNSENKNEALILDNHDQSLEVGKSLKDAAVPFKLDPNVDDSDFLCAHLRINSNDVNAVDYPTSNCIPVNDETVCLELSVAKVQDVTEREAGSNQFSFQKLADNETESYHVLDDLVLKVVDSTSNEEVSTSGSEESVADEPVVEDKTAHSDVVTPVVLEETGNAVVVTSVTEKSENTTEEIAEKDTGNAGTVTDTTEENDCTFEELIRMVDEETTNADVTAITEEKECSNVCKAEEIVEKETAGVDMVTSISEENERCSDKPETSCEELIARADTVIADTFQVDTEISHERISVEEPNEESSKQDTCASLRLLDSTEEHFTDLNTEVTGIPEIKQELIPSNSDVQNADNSLPTTPCQFIVPIVNVCLPISEETYDGLTDDESEISHATSDSESDSNVKMVKPLCDGINTINYIPLLEEDSNDRSTLSLISELDDASVKEDNAESEQWENESASLLSDDGTDRLKNTVSNSELVQRVEGQRISHETMAVELEETAPLEEESIGKDLPSAEYAAKIKDIKEALKCSASLERLRELAQSAGGLVTDEIRKEAWPRLLGIDSSTLSRPLPPINTEELHAHKEYNQVILDVNRSLRRFPSKISAVERANLQNQLTEIILRVLMKRGDLSYYQGYHDVAVTTLLVAGKDTSYHILERISMSHLSDCMLPTMERTIYLLNYIYPLIERINPRVVERMDRLEIGTTFCLPWFLTWYGYSLNRYKDIVRVFDYFLASPPLAPLYLAAVVVGRRSAEVLAADSDFATVHSLLSRIPETLPLEDLLQEALDLYRQLPPESIKEEVEERCEKLRKAQEEEEEKRILIRQRRMGVRRRHSMPTASARQMLRWYYVGRFLGLPDIQRNRLIQVSATFFLGVIAWQLPNIIDRFL